MSQGLGGVSFPSATITTPHPFGTRCPCPQLPTTPLHALELLPSAAPGPPRPTPCSCGH